MPNLKRVGSLAPNALVGFEQRLLARARGVDSVADSEVVVGFSGGPDSLALAVALARIAPRAKLRPVLCHVDHGARPGSALDQAEAEAMARRLGLPFVGRAFERTASAAHPGAGPEEAMRRERYATLASVARERGSRTIALGHHAGDQAETVLLHLARGAGLHGAAGMRELTAIVVPWWPDAPLEPTSLHVWRPLLEEQRATICAYLRKAGLTPFQDPTNDDPGFRRNALRAEVLPALERSVPGAGAALARFAELAAEDDATLNEIVSVALRSAQRDDGALTLSAVSDVVPGLRRRLVRGWIDSLCPGLDVTRERTDAVIRLAAGIRGGAIVELGTGHVVARDGKVLRLRRPG